MQNLTAFFLASFLVVVNHPGCSEKHRTTHHPPEDHIITDKYVKGALIGYDTLANFGLMAVYEDHIDLEFDPIAHPLGIYLVTEDLDDTNLDTLRYFKLEYKNGFYQAFDIRVKEPRSGKMHDVHTNPITHKITHHRFAQIPSPQNTAHTEIHLLEPSLGGGKFFLNVANDTESPYEVNSAIYAIALGYWNSGQHVLWLLKNNNGEVIKLDDCHWHTNRKIECKN